MLKFNYDPKTVTFNFISVANTILRYIERVQIEQHRCSWFRAKRCEIDCENVCGGKLIKKNLGVRVNSK